MDVLVPPRFGNRWFLSVLLVVALVTERGVALVAPFGQFFFSGSSSGKPLTSEEVRRLVQPEEAKLPPRDLARTVHSDYLTFPRGTDPNFAVNFEKVTSSASADEDLWKLKIEAKGGCKRSAGSGSGSSLFPKMERSFVSHRLLEREGWRPSQVKGFRPEFAGLHPFPTNVTVSSKEHRLEVRLPDGTPVDSHYIFKPDGRYIFYDHTYPWCCFGRIWSEVGISSGVLVGPRHVLMASHGMNWDTMHAVRFDAHYYNGEYIDSSWTKRIVTWERINIPDFENADEDFAVAVLEEPLGERLGYWGTKKYNSDWQGKNIFSQCGYPITDPDGTVLMGEKPAFQTSFSLKKLSLIFPNQLFSDTGDMVNGHSGGPVFAWWKGEDWPSVVATYVGATKGLNWFTGGGPSETSIPKLVSYARKNFP